MRGARFALVALLAGCAPPEGLRSLPQPTRGVLILSISGLRADAVSPRSAPFLSQLADRGLTYQWAVVPGASTLATQSSLATGLHPGELGIDHILLRPSPEIEMLAERFARFGFATGGFTEGGFVSRAWGFERGFDEFSDPTSSAPDATSRSLERSLAFLDRLPDEQRFLLFVHTAALAPPWVEDAAFAELRQGRADLAADGAAPHREAYETALARLDGEIRAYFAKLEQRGLLTETTVAVLGDHGEEFLEHGRLGHDQLYPEVTRVPLIVLHPDAPAQRVDRLVRTTDLMPTLSLLAGLPPSLGLVGGFLPTPLRALVDPPATIAWAETFGAVLQRSVWLEVPGEVPGTPELYQLVETRVEGERDGTWVNRRVAFDVEIPAEAEGLTLRLVSFAEERALEVSVDGEPGDEILVPRSWRTVLVPMSTGAHRVELATSACSVPAELQMGEDPRCLSFKVEQPPLRRLELFNLTNDPAALDDLSARRPELRARLERLLTTIPARPVARPERLQRSLSIKAHLNSLGYLDWGP